MALMMNHAAAAASDLFFRFAVPVLALTAAVSIRLTVTAVLSHRRRVLEAGRLACALAVELRMVIQHYEDNLALLNFPGATLLSIRTPGAMFRSNSNRLVGLIGERSLAPLIAVYANHERVEALVRLKLRPRGIRPNAAELYESYRARLRERFLTGRELAQVALAAIIASWPQAGIEPATKLSEMAHAGESDVTWREEDLLSVASDPL